MLAPTLSYNPKPNSTNPNPNTYPNPNLNALGLSWLGDELTATLGINIEYRTLPLPVFQPQLVQAWYMIWWFQQQWCTGSQYEQTLMTWWMDNTHSIGDMRLSQNNITPATCTLTTFTSLVSKNKLILYHNLNPYFTSALFTHASRPSNVSQIQAFKI